MGARRRTIEIRLAMRSLGLEHKLDGRPLPGIKYPPEDQLVSEVMQRVASNRYALPTDQQTVRAVLHRYYLDIPAWPFDALHPPLFREDAPPTSVS
jgi:hypothetical protein